MTDLWILGERAHLSGQQHAKFWVGQPLSVPGPLLQQTTPDHPYWLSSKCQSPLSSCLHSVPWPWCGKPSHTKILISNNSIVLTPPRELIPSARKLEWANSQKRILVRILGWSEDRLFFWVPTIVPLKWLPEFTLWPNFGPWYTHDILRKACIISTFQYPALGPFLPFLWDWAGQGDQHSWGHTCKGGHRKKPNFLFSAGWPTCLTKSQPCSIISQPRVTTPKSSHDDTLFSLNEESTQSLPDLPSWSPSWVYLILLYLFSKLPKIKVTSDIWFSHNALSSTHCLTVQGLT